MKGKQENSSVWRYANKIVAVIAQPLVLVVVGTLLILSKVLLFGALTYGDIPAFSVKQSIVNFMYAWGPQQLGTNVRQGFNTVRDQLLLQVSPTDYSYYFLKYMLPLLLIPVMYFWIFKWLGIKNKFVLVVVPLASLFTPIVFGDFLTGQTFWIYLTVPWVFYFAIQIFCFKHFTLRNYCLLAIFLFLSLGALPPIIVPLLIVLVIIGAIGFLLDVSVAWKKALLHYVSAAFVVGGLFFALSAAYLLVASSGQAAYTPASLLGDYYHNYSGTNFLNTLRLAGNNGGGQSTLQYNVPTYLNLAGYCLMALVLIGSLWIGIKDKSSHYRTMTIVLLCTLIFLLGFMNIMAVDPITGTKVFQSQWIVSTIRNPSKLYVLILPIFLILFAFSLQNFMIQYKQSWIKRGAIGILAVILIGLYGWPALRGDLGLLYNREQAIAKYKRDPVDQAVIQKVPSSQRSLLLPANHRDELNYQHINPGFNILQLEGGQPDTTKLMQQMRSSFNNRDDYFFNYLAVGGIDNIFLKKDEASYTESLFDLFPVNMTPAEAARFLSTKLTLQNETADYWQFSNNTSNQLVYSPKSIVSVNGADNLKTKVPFFGSKAAVVNSGAVPASNTNATGYNVYPHLDDGAVIKDGKAQLHDASLLLVDLYAHRVGRERQVVFDIIDPITYVVQRTVSWPIADNAATVTLGTNRYSFDEKKKRLTVRAGDYDAITATNTAIDLANTNPSFEKGIPNLTDATPRQKGAPNLYTRESNDRDDGKKSLLMGTQNHTGFIEKDLPIADFSKDYLVSFSYKNIKGAPLQYKILQDNEPLLMTDGRLDTSRDWQNHDVYFHPNFVDGQPNKIRLVVYTGDSTGDVSENLFDNVLLSMVDEEVGSSVSLPAYRSEYNLTNFQYSATNDIASDNVLSNASFEDGALWGEVGDSTASASGQPSMSAAQTNDAEDGDSSLKLESNNHTAYVAKSVSQYKPNTVYKLSFYYKHVSGRNPTFAIWQDGTSIAQPSQELKGKAGDWEYFETYFIPEEGTTNLTLYLYSPSIGEQTINLYDNVTLQPTSLIANYFEKAKDPEQAPSDIVKNYNRINPTAVSIVARPGAGMVVLNESFHKGWKAYIVRDAVTNDAAALQALVTSSGTEITNHVTVNGFANGWWIDSRQYDSINSKDEYHIVLLYTPQALMYKGFAVSFVTAIGVGGYLIYHVRKHRSKVAQGNK